MVKSELVARLAHRHPELTIDDCHSAVDQLLHSISLQLVAGGRIEIRDFGSFGIVTRSARIGRNPKTGDRCRCPRSVPCTSNAASRCGTPRITTSRTFRLSLQTLRRPF